MLRQLFMILDYTFENNHREEINGFFNELNSTEKVAFLIELQEYGLTIFLDKPFINTISHIQMIYKIRCASKQNIF